MRGLETLEPAQQRLPLGEQRGGFDASLLRGIAEAFMPGDECGVRDIERCELLPGEAMHALLSLEGGARLLERRAQLLLLGNEVDLALDIHDMALLELGK